MTVVEITNVPPPVTQRNAKNWSAEPASANEVRITTVPPVDPPSIIPVHKRGVKVI